MEIVATVLKILPMVIAVVVAIACFFSGIKRGWLLALLRTAVVFGSMLLAVLLTNLLLPSLSGLADSLIKTMDLESTLGLGDISALEEPLMSLVSAAVGAFLFLALFILCDIVLRILFKIFTTSLRRKAKKSFFGGLIGLVCAALVCVCVLMPLSGTLAVMKNVGDTMEAQEDLNREPVQGLLDLSATLDNAPVLQLVNNYGGMTLYNAVSTVKTDLGSAPLSDEACYATEVVYDLSRLAKEPSSYTAKEIAAIRNASLASSKSVVLPRVESIAVRMLADNILEKNTLFDGITVDFGPFMQPFMDCLFRILSECTDATVVGDLNAVADMLEVLVDYRVLADIGSDGATLDNITKPGFVDALRTAITANERFSPLMDELYRISLMAIASSVDTEEIRISHPKTFENIADGVNDVLATGTSTEELSIVIQKMVNDYGDDASKYEGVISFAADALINEFGDRESVSGDDIKDVLDKYADELEKAGYKLSY